MNKLTIIISILFILSLLVGINLSSRQQTEIAELKVYIENQEAQAKATEMKAMKKVYKALARADSIQNAYK